MICLWLDYMCNTPTHRGLVKFPFLASPEAGVALPLSAFGDTFSMFSLDWLDGLAGGSLAAVLIGFWDAADAVAAAGLIK